MDAFEATARRAAERAGRILRERWQERKQIDRKSNAIDLVTDTDRQVEREILGILQDEYPEHAFIAEESGGSVGAEFCWIVDPLDGTTNFAHAYPQFSVSIALARRIEAERVEVIFGLVHDPLRDETFTAHRGGGAQRNGKSIRVSDTPDLESSLLGTGFPYDRRDHAEFYLAGWKAFMMRTQGIRRAGSAALDLAYVAAGRFDGFWEWKLHAWDVAAGSLLVEEAGGRMSDFGGEHFDPFGIQCLATNGRIHGAMLDVLESLRYAPPTSPPPW